MCIRMYSAFKEPGWWVLWCSFFADALADTHQLKSLNSALANVTPRQSRLSDLSAIVLPRQLGLYPRASVGAQRRVRRGPSLGGSTPAGADDSRGALHASPCTLSYTAWWRLAAHPSFLRS